MIWWWWMRITLKWLNTLPAYQINSGLLTNSIVQYLLPRNIVTITKEYPHCRWVIGRSLIRTYRQIPHKKPITNIIDYNQLQVWLRRFSGKNRAKIFSPWDNSNEFGKKSLPYSYGSFSSSLRWLLDAFSSKSRCSFVRFSLVPRSVLVRSSID